jgi:4-hydroxy-2-oxoheptanedioate aldolase
MPFQNIMKQRLDAGKVVLGTWVAYVQTPGIVRMIAEAGFHFCVIDFQHTSLSIETAAAMCDVARGCNITPIVRPAAITRAEVNRLQDSGAAGIMYPDVRSRAEIDEYRSWMLYPPAGTRGIGLATSGADYSLDRDAAGLSASNDAAVVAIQVEHGDAVRDLDQLFSGGGIDMVEVGRNDLAASLGIPGEVGHPRMHEAIRKIIETGHEHNIAIGTGARGAKDAAELIELGVRSLCISADRRILGTFYRSTISDLKPVL